MAPKIFFEIALSMKQIEFPMSNEKVLHKAVVVAKPGIQRHVTMKRVAQMSWYSTRVSSSHLLLPDLDLCVATSLSEESLTPLLWEACFWALLPSAQSQTDLVEGQLVS